MITINNDIQEESCFLYGPNDEFIGEIENELAFLDVRCQIRKGAFKGYYILFKNQRHAINESGNVEDFPDTLFNFSIEHYEELAGLNFKKSLDKPTS